MEMREETCVCDGDSGVIPGSPMLLAGEGLASASVRRTHTHKHMLTQRHTNTLTQTQQQRTVAPRRK